jgi:hypothetical protein
MPKPVMLPMPVEIVLHNPVVVSASGPAYRIIISLTVVFWSGGCRPLPTGDAGLWALARCGASTWRKESKTVKDAISQILPQLERLHARATQRAEIYRQVKVDAGRKGAAVRWQKQKTAASGNFRTQEPIALEPLHLPRKVAPSEGLNRFSANPAKKVPIVDGVWLKDV